MLQCLLRISNVNWPGRGMSGLGLVVGDLFGRMLGEGTVSIVQYFQIVDNEYWLLDPWCSSADVSPVTLIRGESNI